MRNDTPQIFESNFLKRLIYTQKQSICVFLANKLKCFLIYVFHTDIVEMDKSQKNILVFLSI